MIRLVTVDREFKRENGEVFKYKQLCLEFEKYDLQILKKVDLDETMKALAKEDINALPVVEDKALAKKKAEAQASKDIKDFLPFN